MTSTPWQRPERAPTPGPRLSAGTYADMISEHTKILPFNIRRNAIAYMVDHAAPDIVLAESPASMRLHQRAQALSTVSGSEQISLSGVAALYAQRCIRLEDAKRFMEASVAEADWARRLAHRSGISVYASRVGEFCNSLQDVKWRCVHPDIRDGTRHDSSGRRIAADIGKELAAHGPIHAAVASFVVDMIVPIGGAAEFSIHPLYVRDDERPLHLRSNGISRDNPGAALAARDAIQALPVIPAKMSTPQASRPTP